MSTFDRAWAALMQTIEVLRDMQERGASADQLADPVRHARELLDILEEEVDGQSVQVPDARSALAQMRRRLESLEKDVNPPEIDQLN